MDAAKTPGRHTSATGDGRAGEPATGPRPGDRLRAGWAAFRLELWQDWYGVPGATGRAMRRELRTNLLEAVDEPGGVPAATARLGSLRELAREAADPGGVRWTRAATMAALAFVVVLYVQGGLSLVYADGLLAAGGGQGSLFGNEVAASEQDQGLTASTTLGGWPLLLAPLVFLVVARPWRLLRGRVGAA